MFETRSAAKPIFWLAKFKTRNNASAGVAERPSFRSLTIALTEVCNLDCWMCDFAVTKGLRDTIPWQPEEYVEFLRHPFFSSLSNVGLTGGEPFAHSGIKDIYSGLIESYPKLHVSFSSNATLFDRMAETIALTKNWRNTKLFTSIDGVAMHDVQRQAKGAFEKSMRNLSQLKTMFPELHIDIKFTITPVNCSEILEAFNYCTSRGFNFTVKMLENNPYYTNKLSSDAHQEDFAFTDEQVASTRAQLEEMLRSESRSVTPARRHEIREVLHSLEPGWRRTGRCLTPRRGSFLDSRLNFFTCKEYAPVLNLGTQSLDDLMQCASYKTIVDAERANAEACTRCTSQMKMPAWGGLLR